MKDFYYILGTDATCTTVEIREAYRKLSKKFHPDLNQSDQYFENRFKDIQEAYETLSDPIRRRQYDEQLKRQKHYAAPVDESVKPRSRSRTTAIDMFFTLVLIALTLIFGNYVWKSINSEKTGKTITGAVAVNSVVATVPVNTVAHHKKKKHKTAVSAVAEAGPVQETEKTVQQDNIAQNTNSTFKAAPIVSPTKKKTDTIKPQIFKVVNNPLQPVINNTPANNGLPYSSYLRSNVTGVVNMHKLNDISSAIVAVIPANSQVQVLARGNSYYMVRYNAAIGYVPKWTVKTP